MVHGDVFRPPATSPMLLSVFAGSGIQIFTCTIVLMIVAVLGFLSPANRGALLTVMLLLFVFCASFGGYWSARLYKMMGGKLWRRNTLLTAFLYPGVVFTVFFVVNLFVWSAGSSGAVPFPTMLILIVLWFCISVPLVSALMPLKSKCATIIRTNNEILNVFRLLQDHTLDSSRTR